MRAREIWILTGVSAVMACSGPQAAPSPPAPMQQTAAPPEPAYTASARAAPEAAEPDPAPSPPPSSLHVVLDRTEPMELSPLGDVGLLRVGDELLEVREHRLRGELQRARGLPDLATIGVRFAGAWPDNAFAIVRQKDGSSGGETLFFWDGHRWKSKLRMSAGETIADLGRWSIRRELALVRSEATGAARFQVVAGFPVSGLPSSSKGQADCPSRLRADRMVARESGEVIVAGSLCPAGDGAGVERWEGKDRTGRVEALPNAKDLFVNGLVALDASRVALGGRTGSKSRPIPYFALFDGTAWAEERLPFADGIARLASHGAGDVSAVTDAGECWRRASGGGWARIHLPAVTVGDERVVPGARSVWAHGDESAWVIATYRAADGKEHWVVIHDRPLVK